MARADYQEQMERHAGEWDVLPNGLVKPSLPHGDEWGEGECRGVAVLSDEVLEGNRWSAVSGALLAEFAKRCATMGALTVSAPDRRPRPREISLRFRKAIPVADPGSRPHVADGARVLWWRAEVDKSVAGLEVGVEIERQPGGQPQLTISARASFESVETVPTRGGVERRLSDYLLRQKRRLVLPTYHSGWTAGEVRGGCQEPPGSLLAASEQALANAGKIVRGDGTPTGQEESMLLADMTYRWLEEVDDGLVEYVARPGRRSADAKGRDWLDVSAVLSLGGRAVGEATGSIVFRRYPSRAAD